MKTNLSTAPRADAPDAELAGRVALGDTAAFETLMRRHNRMLFRTARAILRDDAEAEDALQEAYAYEALMRCAAPRRHRAAAARRGARPNCGSRHEYDSRALGRAPTGAVAARSRNRRASRRLPRGVHAARGRGFSVEETAEVLRIPQPTVRSRLFRARSLLREALAAKVDVACEEAFGFAGERCDRIVANVLARLP
jgi:RNA polymerase sigma-70 factor (ECF subfamily)